MRLCLALFLLAAAAAGRSPNIVLVLADDLGWADLGCYGNRYIDTPNIDRLASRGVRFTDAYAAAPVCAPTRVSILSGQYPARVGMPMLTRPHKRPWAKLTPPENRHALPTDTTTVAPELARAGYVSTLIGKWHLGYGNRPHELKSVTMPPGFGPPNAAVAFGFIRPPSAPPHDAFVVRNPHKGMGRQTAQAIRFVEQHRQAPFFLFLSYSMVHIPMEARPDLIEKYEKRLANSEAGMDPRYAAMVEMTDESVGAVIDALRRLELERETAVFFFSDNGGLIRVYHGDGPQVTSNGPLRGEKGTLYEGGIRVPLIAALPGVFRAGAIAEEPVISTDLLPTFLELAGLEPPEGYHGDGVSLRRVLVEGAPVGREALYWHYPAYHHSTPASAIRTGRYKLLEFFEDGRRELYDLVDDLSERRDLADEKPQLAAKLAARLASWRERVGAGHPAPNPHHDPARAGVWGVRPEHPWEPAPREPLAIRHVE